MTSPCQELYIPTFDGTYLKGELRLPEGPGPFPAVLYIHGGVGGTPPGPGYSSYVRSHILADGYAYLDLDYRRYHFGAEELEDAVAGYRYLCALPEIISDRVAVLGDSHGGYLALMLATRERPPAVVVYAGLVDAFGLFYQRAQPYVEAAYRNFDWYERWLRGGLSIREEAELLAKGPLPAREPVGIGDEVAQDLAFRWGGDQSIYRRYCPLAQYESIESPILYVVGGEDPFKEGGQKLVAGLQELGRPAVYSEHPGMGHSFAFGRELDEEGDIHPEFYKSLRLTSGFLRQWVKAPATA